MPDYDPDDISDADAYLELCDIEDTALYAQWRAERWIMEFLLTPAKAPRQRTLEHVINVADKRADVGEALAALEHNGLIQQQDGTVSATKAAISLRRLELTRPFPD
jgi:hypothetical protein